MTTEESFDEAVARIEGEFERLWSQLNFFQKFLMRKERSRFLENKRRLALWRARNNRMVEAWLRDER